jgi:hypothetical protein
MKKNMLFLSAAITTFILVIVAALVLKVKTIGLVSPAASASAAPVTTSTQAPTDTLQPTDTATMAPTTEPFISPQEAVTIASKALGNTQIYSVDTVSRYGKDVYKVTFSSGHIVFVNPQGIILAIISPQAAYLAPAPNQPSSNNPPSKNGGGDDSGGSDD